MSHWSPGEYLPLLLCSMSPLTVMVSSTMPRVLAKLLLVLQAVCALGVLHAPYSCQPAAMLSRLMLMHSLVLPCSMMALLEGMPMEPTQTQLEQLEALVGQPAPDESSILTQSRQRVLLQQRHNVHWQQESTAAVCAWLSQHLEHSSP